MYRTDIQAVHINRKGDLKLIQISDDQQKMILDLTKSRSEKCRSPEIRRRAEKDASWSQTLG